MRSRPPLGPVGTLSKPVGVHGDSRFAEFVQDCYDGFDGFEGVTIGHSNIANPSGSGWHVAMAEELAHMGLPVNGTPLMACNTSAAGAAVTTKMGGLFLPHNKVSFPGTSYAAGNQTAAPTSPVLGFSTVAASDPDAIELRDTLGLENALSGNLLPPVAGLTWDAPLVPRGKNFTSQSNSCIVVVSAPSPMAAGNGGAGKHVQYRVVHGNFTATGGQFRLRAIRYDGTGIAYSASYKSTHGATSGWDVEKLDFDSPVISGVPCDFTCCWDGFNAGGAYTAKGPIIMLWQSVIEKRIGFSWSNLISDPGKTTAQIVDKLENMEGLLDSFLKELHDRQVEAGGSGRVVIYWNSGINGSETASQFLAYIDSAKQYFYDSWVNRLGFDRSSLALVVAVDHPQAPGATETRLATLRSAANKWAKANKNDGSGTTVIDFSELTSYDQLTNLRMYEINSNAQQEAHLRGTIVSASSPANGLYNSGNYHNQSILNCGYRFGVRRAMPEIMKQVA